MVSKLVILIIKISQLEAIVLTNNFPSHTRHIHHFGGDFWGGDFPANAVLDLQLPLGTGGPKYMNNLAAAMRTFATLGGATLQTNAVSVTELRDAKLHPEQHQDLVVRISGLSARFITLAAEVQDEMISRHTGNL